MPSLCVVHLVYEPIGLDPLRRFLESYRRNTGGAAHRLVMLFSGFGGHVPREYRAELEGFDYGAVYYDRPGPDVPAYLSAARELDCEYLCFLNSYSELLDPDWLAKLCRHGLRDGVGAAGATGSWQSPRSHYLYAYRKRSAYNGLLEGYNDYVGHEILRPYFELSDELAEDIRGRPPLRRLAARAYYFGLVRSIRFVTRGAWDRAGAWWRFERRKWRMLRRYAAYPLFPNYHLRTNAFMIGRETMLGLRTWEMRTKEDTYRFESGRESMTSQLLRAGLKVLVVGRDGRGYDKEEWAASETFWQGGQRNLLVADNRTKEYERGDERERGLMSRLAWGREAAPTSAGPPNAA